LLPKRYGAIALWSHVLTQEPSLSETILRHEWAHVDSDVARIVMDLDDEGNGAMGVRLGSTTKNSS
jgi:hypothetical protein